MSDVASLVRRYVERYNANDVDGMLECCADDVVFETISNPGGSIRLSGKDEMRGPPFSSVDLERRIRPAPRCGRSGPS